MRESAPASGSCHDKPDKTTTDRGADEAQREAIHHYEGPCEVLAGPGSGKTFVLVQRILCLIREYHVPPDSILVLTFSKAAAQEMEQRFRRKSTPEHYDVTFGTFHSVFYRILQESSGRTFSILSQQRQKGLLESLIRRHLGRPPKADETENLASLIARTRSTERFPAQGDPESIANFRGIYEDYRGYLEDNGLIDFEDMISESRQLLRRNPQTLRRWQECYRFLLVDEFQDINAGQFDVLRMLAGARRNLFVVGDDDQSIYGFRGSDPRFMIEFAEIFPGTRRIVLNRNYRCRTQIVHCSQLVIRDNRNRLAKSIRPVRTGGSCVFLQEFESEKEQYAALCGTLRGMDAPEADSTAVIVRTHTQMRGLIRALEQEEIPYREWTGTGVQRAARIAPQAAADFDAVLGYWRLAGELSSDRVTRRSLFQVLNRPERWLLRKDFRKELYAKEELLGLFPEGSREARSVRGLCRDLTVLCRLRPALALQYLQRSVGLSLTDPAVQSALTAMAGECGSFQQMLGALESADLHRLLADQKREPPHGVRLLTMHACKGLEFSTVILPDLNEGILPNRRARSPEAVEEERRLFYVAMTRARDRLFLLCIRGDPDNPRLPCRFLKPLGVREWTDT